MIPTYFIDGYEKIWIKGCVFLTVVVHNLDLHQPHKKIRRKITPAGGVGFLQNFEPPGAHGTTK